jgi:hypothetical protein
MKRAGSVLGWVGLACIGCGTGSPVDPAAASGVVTGCEVGAPLAGAAYDIKKSRFAFGSTPTQDDASGFVRWVGVDGVIAIEQSGGELGILNGGAPEASLPDWSDDPAALSSHVTAYFATFGVSVCQIGVASVHGGSGGRTIALARSVDGINVAESLASIARTSRRAKGSTGRRSRPTSSRTPARSTRSSPTRLSSSRTKPSCRPTPRVTAS